MEGVGWREALVHHREREMCKEANVTAWSATNGVWTGVMCTLHTRVRQRLARSSPSVPLSSPWGPWVDYRSQPPCT